MRRVGVSQDEIHHLVLNPRKLAHLYRTINFLRYRVLSPAPLAMLGYLREFEIKEGPRPGFEPGPLSDSFAANGSKDPQSLRTWGFTKSAMMNTTTTPSRPLLNDLIWMDRPGFEPGAYGYVNGGINSTMPTCIALRKVIIAWRSSS